MKRLISCCVVFLCVCMISTIGFAYDVDAWAGITGDSRNITCQAHASTTCLKTDLQGSSYQGDITEDGRQFYQFADGQKTSFNTTWDVKNPSGLYYVIHMEGAFHYKHGIAADSFKDDGTKSFILLRSGLKSTQEPEMIIADGFKNALAESFEVDLQDYDAIIRTGERYKELGLKELDSEVDWKKGDTIPTYLLNRNGKELLILKQDVDGVNYLFEFSVQDGAYILKNVQEKQGTYIDGKTFLQS